MNISNNNNNTTREAGTDSIPGTSMSDSCKDGVSSKSNEDDVCDVNKMLQNMSTADDKDIVVSVCANCSKEGSDINNVCNKCKKVKYCNAACKKKHRHKHKKDCEEHIRLATEIHDEELFKQPPPDEDCPICFQRLPSVKTGFRYKACCGKVICSGCAYALVYDDQGNEVDNQKCPFCRTPWPSSEKEATEREKKRMKVNDPIAIYDIGCWYKDGDYGYPQDYNKAFELYHRAAELGYANAYNSIGCAYELGEGAQVDEKKAKYYYELAAMGGNGIARYNLGEMEEKVGNMERALKHYMIAVRDGDSESLNMVKELYSKGQATKEDYTKALQSYQVYLGEIKSIQRDKAAAADEECRYY